MMNMPNNPIDQIANEITEDIRLNNGLSEINDEILLGCNVPKHKQRSDRSVADSMVFAEAVARKTPEKTPEQFRYEKYNEPRVEARYSPTDRFMFDGVRPREPIGTFDITPKPRMDRKVIVERLITKGMRPQSPQSVQIQEIIESVESIVPVAELGGRKLKL